MKHTCHTCYYRGLCRGVDDDVDGCSAWQPDVDRHVAASSVLLLLSGVGMLVCVAIKLFWQ